MTILPDTSFRPFQSSLEDYYLLTYLLTNLLVVMCIYACLFSVTFRDVVRHARSSFLCSALFTWHPPTSFFLGLHTYLVLTSILHYITLISSIIYIHYNQHYQRRLPKTCRELIRLSVVF